MKQKAKVNISWDGEKVKLQTIVPEEKVTPKQFMDGLDNAKNQLTQAQQQKEQAEQQIKQMDEAISSIKDFLEERKEYEVKCNEIMEEKLKGYVKTLTPELVKEAEEESKKIFDSDPNSMTNEQQSMQKYLIYQRKLATLPKVAENISQDLIKEKLFNKPMFKNPFA